MPVKAKTPPQTPLAVIDNAAWDQDKQAAMTATALKEHEVAVSAEIADAYSSHGRLQAFNGIRNLVAAATIQELQKLRDSKGYKKIVLQNGRAATSFEEYCELGIGISKSTAVELIASYNLLGDCFDNFRELGITRGSLRKLRGLPAEDIIDIKSLGVSARSKEELVDLIDELHAKHQQAESQLKIGVEQLLEAQAQNTKLDAALKQTKKNNKREAAADPDADRVKSIEVALADFSADAAKLLTKDCAETIREFFNSGFETEDHLYVETLRERVNTASREALTKVVTALRDVAVAAGINAEDIGLSGEDFMPSMAFRK